MNSSHILTLSSVLNISMLAKMLMMVSSLYHFSSIFILHYQNIHPIIFLKSGL